MMEHLKFFVATYTNLALSNYLSCILLDLSVVGMTTTNSTIVVAGEYDGA